MGNDSLVRLGFIGAGGICRQRHFPGLKKLGGIDLIAVCNRSEASGKSIAEEYGFVEVMTDWRELISRADIDAVFIGSYPDTHAELSCSALEAGKHVFCQARMADTLEGAQRMMKVAEAHPGQVNMLCPPPHRMPWESYILQSMKEERFGNPLEIRISCTNGSGFSPLSFRDKVEFSGLQIMFVGIWAETLISWFGEYESLSADFSTPVSVKNDPNGNAVTMKIPQVVNISGRLESGVHVSEYHSGVSLNETLNLLEVFTDRGTLRIQAMTKLEWAERGGEFQSVQVPDNLQRDWQVEADFIAAVRLAMAGTPASERQVCPDFAEGMRYMRKMAAVHLSANESRMVNLSEIG